MLFQNLSVATLLAALPSALALPSNHTLPKVTIKALPADCSSYPGYNADSKTAGPWIVQLNKSENPALESFGNSVIYSTSTGPSGISAMSSGHISIVHDNMLAKSRLQCQDSGLQVYTQTTVDSNGDTTGTAEWTPLALGPHRFDAGLMYLTEGEAPTLYEHYIGEKKQAGYFVGGYNTTTWGVRWSPAAPGYGSYKQPYYYLRLLPEGEKLKANETRAFLKILEY